MQIPFIGVTGEFGVGKTLFGLLIDPERCVHFDFEKSAQTYESSLPFKRIDMQDLARSKFSHNRFRPSDLFCLWRETFTSMPKGQYRVAVIDDASSLEDGLFEYVRSHPAEFGYTAAQFAKSEPMVWGAGKAFYKQLMLAAGIECCVMVTHMRAQFAGNRPTGKREAKGKETIMELASLYLMLDRKPDEKGRVPEKPNAVKLKDRLSVFVKNPQTGEFEPHPVLPPRITLCTPARLRWYMQNPPDYAKLKKDELALPEQLSDDEKLILQAQMASDQKEAAVAQSANQAAVNEAAKIRLAAMQSAPAGQATDQSNTVHQATAEKTEAAAVQAYGDPPAQDQTDATPAASDSPDPEVLSAPATPAHVGGSNGRPSGLGELDSSISGAAPITTDQLERIRQFKVERLKIPNDAWKAIIAKRGVASARNLTAQQADDLIANLTQRYRRDADKAHMDEWANAQVVKNLASGSAAMAAINRDDSVIGYVEPNGQADATERPPFDVPANQPA